MENGLKSKDVVDEEQDKSISSKSIVKCYAAETPKTFTKLQLNTNLNYPPSNWLSTSVAPYGLQNAVSHSTGFSSFHMAHMFPDCIGEVDVISDAENIKKLLKLPYSNGQVSMMVHRVENTLLIDDFDVYKHLLLTAETEWKWVKKFFSEHIRKLITKEDIMRHFYNKSRSVLQQKSLNSKFLYYSLLDANFSETTEKNIDKNITNNQTSKTNKHYEPLLPEPNYDEQYPDAESDRNYNRNIIWSFENLQMLLGTNLPIFGGNNHPCISLKLRDMSTPINVLTGIDYWLDNLMSNAPEVIMCYHLDGIVQKYEIIKTEELPNLERSKFSPKVIYDLAKNILAFLKTNVTKAGHTYWLFKGNNDDIVKLYDLTCLCTPEDSENQSENPFTVPVAMLLYRVARNMKYSTDQSQKLGAIKMLLNNSISLLNKEKYPEIIASSHFMLSDIYVPSTIDLNDPKVPKIDDCINPNAGSESTCQLDLNKDKYTWKKDTKRKKSKKLLIDENNKDFLLRNNCELALKHILEGFQCLKLMMQKNQDLPMAKPNEKIPMKEVILKSFKNCSSNTKDMQAWNLHLKKLFIEKICLIYSILIGNEFENKKYGKCLKHIYFWRFFTEKLLGLQCAKSAKEQSLLFSRLADCCYMIVVHWTCLNDYKTEFESLSLIDEMVKSELNVESNLDHNLNLISDLMAFNSTHSIEDFLLASYDFYRRCLKLLKGQNCDEIQKRFGNIQNELGSYYISKLDRSDHPFDDNFNKASSYFEEGIQTFKLIKDIPNLALVKANFGRLMKLKALFYSKPEHINSKLQIKYLKKSSLFYKEALNCMPSRKSNCQVWDAIHWDLSSTILNTAVLMYEDSNCSEFEVIELLNEALSYSNLKVGNSRSPMYRYQAAIIYWKLAGFYGEICKKQRVCSFKDYNAHLAEINFVKSLDLSLDVFDFNQCLEILLVKFELFISITENYNGNKLKSFEKCFSVVLEFKSIFEKNRLYERNNTVYEADKIFRKSLIIDVFKKTQFVFQNMLKLYKKKNEDLNDKFSNIKKAYEVLLKASTFEESNNHSLIESFLQCLTYITPNSK